MKRTITLLLVLCLTLSLAVMAGCGKSQTSNSDLKNNNANDAEDMIFYDIPDELKGTTVKFATWIDHTQTESAKVMSDFQGLTDIKVELVNVPQGQYTVKVASLIAADQAPDMLVKNEFFAQTFQIAQPVENVGIDVTDPVWNDRVIKLGCLDGKHYLLAGSNDAWNMSGGVIYFNKSIFAENGIKTPGDYVKENDWNLDTFWTCMSQVEKIIGEGNSGTWICCDVLASAFDAPLVSYDADNAKFVNNIKSDKSEALLKAWQFMRKANEAGLYSVTFAGDNNQFMTGKTGMYIGGCFGLRLHGWFQQMDIDDVGYTYLPKINKDDENYPSTQGIRAYAICKGAKNPVAAGYFIRYYINMDHYDIEDVYKTKEARELQQNLNATATLDGVDCQYSVAALMLENPWQITKPLYESSSAQLATNFSITSNQVDACIEKANEILGSVIEENK